MSKKTTISVDGIEYVRADSVPNSQPAVNTDGLKYVIVRGDRSGVFAGYLGSEEGRTVILNQCRRIWYWSGAASISQLAMDGVSDPSNCKFPVEVTAIKILDAIEVIDCTEKARLSIKDVEIWQK